MKTSFERREKDHEQYNGNDYSEPLPLRTATERLARCKMPSKRYGVVALVLNLPNADLQPGQVSLNPKQKALFSTAIPTITGALDRIIKG